MRVVTYGPGGYDPAKPGGNVVEDRAVPVPPEETNVAAIRDSLRQGMAAFQAIIDAVDPPAGNLTAAQLSTIVRSLATNQKILARGMRRLVRLGLADHSGSD